jgi:hypothetical protein
LAVGDVVNDLQSINAGSYLDIQPSAGVETVIHNIYHNGDITIEFYDGSNSCIFDTDTGSGVYARYAFHCTNTKRIRVKNTAATAKLIGYDGVQTK